MSAPRTVRLVGGELDGSNVNVDPDRDQLDIREMVMTDTGQLPTGRRFVYNKACWLVYNFDHEYSDGAIVTLIGGFADGTSVFAHESNQRLVVPDPFHRKLVAAYDRHPTGKFVFKENLPEEEAMKGETNVN